MNALAFTVCGLRFVNRKLKTVNSKLVVAAVTIAVCLSANSTEYKQAIEPPRLEFPRDHASHAGFQTEWWYFTGNVYDAGGRRFGYEFTLFRRAAHPLSATERGRKSNWAASDFYLGHFAISDIASKQFYFEEAARRDALGLSGATAAAGPAATTETHVWLGEWDLKFRDKQWQLKAAAGEIAIDLTLLQTLAPVTHGRPGEEGLSRKGPNAGQASYYYSMPQLQTTGSLTVGGKKYGLTNGVSWMDHEFGSNQLSDRQSGWDWFALQLDDGSALMLYLLRNKDGSVEPASSGTWIKPDGSAVYIPLKDIEATRGREWTSPHSGRRYAVTWTLKIPTQQIELSVSTAQDNQEPRGKKTGRISYYEGAVDVRGSVGGKAAKGTGYLEITGAPGGGAEEIEGLGGRL